jgi:hypothetical protein
MTTAPTRNPNNRAHRVAVEGVPDAKALSAHQCAMA